MHHSSFNVNHEMDVGLHGWGEVHPPVQVMYQTKMSRLQRRA